MIRYLAPDEARLPTLDDVQLEARPRPRVPGLMPSPGAAWIAPLKPVAKAASDETAVAELKPLVPRVEVREVHTAEHEPQEPPEDEGRFTVSYPAVSAVFSMGAADAASFGRWTGTFRGVTLGTAEDVWVGARATRVVVGHVPAEGEVGVAHLEAAAVRGEETLAWVESAVAAHVALDTAIHLGPSVGAILRLGPTAFKLINSSMKTSSAATERVEADERAEKEEEAGTHADGEEGEAGAHPASGAEEPPEEHGGDEGEEGGPSYGEMLEERRQAGGVLHLHAENEVVVTSPGSVATSAIHNNLVFGGLLAEVVGGASAGVKGGISAELQALGKAEVSSTLKTSVEAIWDVEIAAHRGEVEIVGAGIEIGSSSAGRGLPGVRQQATSEIGMSARDAIRLEAGEASGPTVELDAEHHQLRLHTKDSFVLVEERSLHVHGEDTLRLSVGKAGSLAGLSTLVAAARKTREAAVGAARSSWKTQGAQALAAAMGTTLAGIPTGSAGERVRNALTGVAATLTTAQAVLAEIRNHAVEHASEAYAGLVAGQIRGQKSRPTPAIQLTSDGIDLTVGATSIAMTSAGITMKVSSTELRMDAAGLTLGAGKTKVAIQPHLVDVITEGAVNLTGKQTLALHTTGGDALLTRNRWVTF